MNKTTTAAAITVILLLLGGGSLHLLHQSNQEATARVEELKAQKVAAAGTGQQTRRASTSSSTAERRATRDSPMTASALRVQTANTEYMTRLIEGVKVVRLGGVIRSTITTKVVDEMNEMDLETLNQLLILAEENDANALILSLILDRVAAKSPADATTYAASIVANATTFERSLSSKLGEFFRQWMKTDPSAAEQWYATAMASGELIPKSLPEAGDERFMPDRTVMGNRFKALLDAGSEQAISMVGEMSDKEVVYAMSSLSDDYSKANTAPGFISRIVRELSPQQQNDALSGYVEYIAGQDFTRASAWVDAVDIADPVQASLMSRAAQVAYEKKKLSQSEALKIIEVLPDSRERTKALRAIEGN